jgi:hypothetical protein
MNSENIFNERGRKAEEFVFRLAKKTFLSDWCYLRPHLPKSKGNKELCDLLIVFDDVAIIWQIKNTKLDKFGKREIGDIEKNKRQLLGAKRQLFELKTEISLENPRRGNELFDPSLIKRIYLISALLGPEEVTYSFVDITENNNIIHSFSEGFTEVVLKELDTIKDFTNYLNEKESLIRSVDTISLIGGEKELLANYLANNRTFSNFYQMNNVIIENENWKYIVSKPEFIAKKEEDKISYGWDNIIERAHTGGEKYEIIARELARPSRFERRMLSKSFLDAWTCATHDKINNRLFRVIFGIGTTYCFIFMDPSLPHEFRKSMLQQVCFVARGLQLENKKVIGIATEMKLKPECSYDYYYLEKLDWTTDDQNIVKKMQEKNHIFLDPKTCVLHEVEYPTKKENRRYV